MEVLQESTQVNCSTKLELSDCCQKVKNFSVFGPFQMDEPALNHTSVATLEWLTLLLRDMGF